MSRRPCRGAAGAGGGGRAHARLYSVMTCRQLSSCRLYSWILFTCTSNMEAGLIFTLYSFSRKAENFSLFSWGGKSKDGWMAHGNEPRELPEVTARSGLPGGLRVPVPCHLRGGQTRSGPRAEATPGEWGGWAVDAHQEQQA